MKITTLIAAALTASAIAVSAVPAAAYDYIDARQDRQIQRIEQGLRSGQLTRAEYHRLMEQQREIARLEHMLSRDGRLSPRDRVLLSRLQNEASREIFWQKHDGDNRYDARPGRGWGNGWGNSWGWNRGWGREYQGYGYGRGWNRDSGWYR